MPRLLLRVGVALATVAAAGILIAAVAARPAPAGPASSILPRAKDLATAHDIVAGMSLEEKAGQVLLVGVGGKGSAAASSLGMLREVAPGGILLFGFNVPADPEDLCPALRQYQEAAAASGKGLSLLVAIDHEGGSVFRFKGGITRPPAPLETAMRGPAYARLLGEREALELGDLGIDLVLGPVVEALTDDNVGFLGNRSFGRDAGRVDSIASAYIQGLAAGGAIAVAKHFPADGPADPHKSLPRLAIPAAELKDRYLARFAAAIGAGTPAIMLSHIVVEAVDPGWPASLSPLVIALLRRDLGFRGVILTDDLLMKAIAMSPRLAARKALAAGADLLMLSSEDAAVPVRDAIVEAVRDGSLSEARLDEAVERIVALKLAAGTRTAAIGSAANSQTRCAGFRDRVAESGRLLSAAASEAH